jgi:hypothetical protein
MIIFNVQCFVIYSLLVKFIGSMLEDFNLIIFNLSYFGLAEKLYLYFECFEVTI